MANTSVAPQSSAAPELVEILKQLALHRRKLYDSIWGRGGRYELAATLNTLDKVLRLGNGARAEDLLDQLVSAAAVELPDASRREILANPDGAVELHRLVVAAGFAPFAMPLRVLVVGVKEGVDPAFPDGLAPGCEVAFSPSRQELDSWRHHPLAQACKWLEQRLAIDRHELETAAFRLTTPLGLRGMAPLIRPDGTSDDDDKGQPDWLWMIPKFRELDQDGTTARLWQSLLTDYLTVLVEAGLVSTDAAEATAKSPTAKTKQDKGDGGAGSTPKKPANKTGQGEGKGENKGRGAHTKKETIRRADFSKPLREEGESWPNIYTAYAKKYPRDVDASEDVLRRAFERQYPEIAAKLKEGKAMK